MLFSIFFFLPLIICFISLISNLYLYIYIYIYSLMLCTRMKIQELLLTDSESCSVVSIAATFYFLMPFIVSLLQHRNTAAFCHSFGFSCILTSSEHKHFFFFCSLQSAFTKISVQVASLPLMPLQSMFIVAEFKGRSKLYIFSNLLEITECYDAYPPAARVL